MPLVSNKKTACLILLFISFFVYGNTLFGNFVWDDHYLIQDNPAIKSASSIPNFFTKDFWENSSINFQSGFYRPFVLLTFFVNSHLWGGQPFGFHLFNVILHSLNGILIFLIFLYLTENQFVAFLSALFFIIHPAQTEAVAYIADIGDILVVFFLLLCFRYYLFFAKGNKRSYDAIASVVFFTLALLSKEHAMVGLGLILLVDWFYVSKQDGRKFITKIPVFSSYFVTILLYLLIRVFVLGKLNAVTILENVRYVSILPSFNLWSHLLTVVKIVFLYIQLLVLPLTQNISYVMLPAVSFWSLDVFFAAVFLIILGVLIVICRHREYQWITFSLLWFFVAIAPLSNLMPISNTIAERFLYLPMVGFAFLLANCFYALKVKWKRGSIRLIAFYGIFCFLVLFLVVKTVSRNLIWQNDFRLFSSATDTRPCAPLSHMNLSAYYYQHKNNDKGQDEYNKYISCLHFIQKEYQNLQNQIRGKAGGK